MMTNHIGKFEVGERVKIVDFGTYERALLEGNERGIVMAVYGSDTSFPGYTIAVDNIEEPLYFFEDELEGIE